ncbi:MAG: hypothetical protein JWR85_510, partial [Marmoricola sp.]|nr:hypothetical protein [Marmoricola sp.]
RAGHPSGSAAVQDLGIVSYAGVPVRDGAGEVFGTLCGASATPQLLDPWAVSVMELFAELIAGYLPALREPAHAATPAGA